VSEVLALTPARVDIHAHAIVLETLKKRRSGVFRSIPVPASLLEDLDRIHGIAAAQSDAARCLTPIWSFGRTTAWSIVKRAMASAAIDGPRASPKGLRHAFAISALQGGVPITLVRKWLGHSRVTTTEIYTDVMGDEEQQLASRLWQVLESAAPHCPVNETAA
jgi:integrase